MALKRKAVEAFGHEISTTRVKVYFADVLVVMYFTVQCHSRASQHELPTSSTSSDQKQKVPPMTIRLSSLYCASAMNPSIR